MFRKDNKLIKAWEKNGPEFYSQIQRNIILAGADMLKPGGKLYILHAHFQSWRMKIQ